VFIYSASDVLLIILLYVKDIIFTGSSPAFLHHVIHLLVTHFSMKDLGDLHHFLGVQVLQTPDLLFLSQHKYIHDLLTRFNLNKHKPICIALSSRTMLSLIVGDLLLDATEYRSMVGALQYLTMTRPDITYVVNFISRFMHAPRITNLFAVQHIFRYLLGATDHGLVLKQAANLNVVLVYSDAD